MRRLLSTLLLFATLGRAQMRDLATTFDGSVVHFTTDMRLAGTLDGPQGKIYKWENGNFSVVLSPNITPLGFRSVNLFGPVISDDGATYGYSLAGFITDGEYVYKDTKINAGGVARLSQNGRYGLRGWGGGGSAGSRMELGSTEPTVRVGSVWDVTNGGELLKQIENSLYVGERLVATAPGKILSTAMDATGSRVVYVTQHDGLLDLREGNSVLVSLSDNATALRAELSSDGSRLLVIETIGGVSRAFWMQRSLPNRNQLGMVRGDTATISGDGRIGWLLQTDGRLTRVALDSGERESMNEALPEGLPLSSGVRGSLTRWELAALGDGPWLLTLVSETQQSASLRLPVLEAKADHVDFQIPWQLSDTFTYSWPGLQRPGGIFEVVGELLLSPILPRFWSEPTFYPLLGKFFGGSSGSAALIKAIHQGFDRQVTPNDPAVPGEVVHLYLSGLGPVTPVQTDNTPATAPPATINTTLLCGILGGGNARVLFAGLSVGLVGVYQVELEIPNPLPPIYPMLTCSVPTQGAVLQFTGYLPVAQ